MANVTQTIPNFLLGVTRVPDFNKTPGMVRDLLNGYTDTTYGLLKRSGTQHLWSDAIDDIQGDDVNDCFFDVIDREGDPLFLVVINSESSFGGNTQVPISIYNLDTGELAKIDYSNALNPAQPFIYLRKDDSDSASIFNQGKARIGWGPERYQLASDDKRTVVVNRTQRPFNGNVESWSSGSGDKFEWASEQFRTAGNIGALPDSSAKSVTVTSFGPLSPPINENKKLRYGWNVLGTTNESLNNTGTGLTVRVFIQETDDDTDGFISSQGQHKPSIVSPGYGYYDGQELRINGVTGAKLTVTTGLEVGKVYHVTGPTSSEGNTDDSDDYYMMPLASLEKTIANGTTEYEGFFWVEAPQPDARRGINPILMPHELVYLGRKEDADDGNKKKDTFLWQPIDYAYRWVGNNDTNPDPSFVDNFIESAFFHNNRLGFLSRDKVILSRPIVYTDESDKDPENAQDIVVPNGNPYIKRNPREIDFYMTSSMQLNDGDPIDIAAANNLTSNFTTAISTPQGVILFGNNCQSILAAPNGGPLTPSQANISNLSVYEVDKYVKPVSMDSDYYFIDQSSSACRMHRMSTNFESAPANTVNISKLVQDWIPTGITDVATCSSAGFVMAFKRDQDQVYIYKTEGEFQAWFKWKLPEKIFHIFAKNDDIYFVTATSGSSKNISVSVASIFLLPNIEVMEGTPNNMGPIITPYLDRYFIPPESDVTVANGETTVQLPDNYFTNATTFKLVTAGNPISPFSVRSVGFASSGNVSTGTRSGTEVVFPVELVTQADVDSDPSLTKETDKVVVGIPYNFEVEFPRFYFQNNNGADYTAYLTIARAKFAISLSGDYDFLIKSGNNPEQSLWSDATVIPETFTDANYYLADTAAMDFAKIAYIPIHQRNNNFLLKMKSDSPFPLSIDSCMWEGNYSPRYYRRN